ncbi:unnamed protein product [Lasius platythorax]|uniref:Uncharacterized protein n=1 Tax=Lasius platythorax TaxID=488582 RepID=A0AAV2NW64_9HYME
MPFVPRLVDGRNRSRRVVVQERVYRSMAGKCLGEGSGEPVAVLFSESPRYQGAQCAISEPLVPGDTLFPFFGVSTLRMEMCSNHLKRI